MSIRAASKSGINNGQRDFPLATQPYPTATTGSWSRPSDWPALPSQTTSDQVFNGLLAVTNDTSNYVGLTATISGVASSPTSCFIGNGAATLASGNIFIVTGGSLTLNNLIVNQYVTGTGVSAGTYITSASTASFTVSSGLSATMVVTSVSSGTLAVGMSVTHSTGGAFTPAGRYIVSQSSGTPGGAGTYVLNNTITTFAPTGGWIGNVNNSQLVSTAFSATITGSYTVDWGDGAGNIMYPSNIVAQNQYNYSTLGTSVTTRGYKTALVKLSPLAGNLTSINLQTKYVPVTGSGTLNAYVTKWLDIAWGSPSLTGHTIGGNTTPLTMLEQAAFYVSGTFNTAASSLFLGCSSLQSVPVLNLSSGYTTLVSMFSGCRSLKNVPVLPATSYSSGVDCTNMFNGCSQLETIPDSVFANLANKLGTVASMFINCVSLKSLPMLSWASGTYSADSMFSACTSLRSVPAWNFRFATLTTSMFSGCSALQTVPALIFTSATGIGSMFANCYALVSVDVLTFPAATGNIQNMFLNCYSLKTVAALNIPLITSILSSFSGCTNLQYVGPITTGTNLTSTYNMFANCRSLVVAPTISTTTNLANTNIMFSSCSSLQQVPLYNLSNVTDMSSMFASCTSLVTIPTFVTTKVSNMNSTFTTCSSLQSIPALDTSNVTDMTSTFQSCVSLTNVAFTNTTKVTTMTSMFNGCTSLTTEDLVNGGANSWNTSNVTTMSSMFTTCSLLTTIPTFNTSNVTNTVTMFSGCTSLNSVPALNLTNVTASTTMFNGTTPTLSSVAMTNVKTSTSFASSELSKAALETIFANTIVPNAISQTITITGNPGTDTARTQTGTTTANSNVITMANTVNLTANMVMTSGNGFGITGRPVNTYNSNNNIVLTTGQAPANGMPVSFNASPVNGAPYVTYYVANSGVSGTNVFQISSSNGGSALTLATTGTPTAFFSTYIVTVNANSNIVLSNPANAAFTSNSYTFRTLDVSQAVLKNWIVTG